MANQPDRLGPPLPLNDMVVLALLTEEPAHGFALARQLGSDSDLGRILTLGRSQIYRSLDRLESASMAEPVVVEPGDAGPKRTVYRVTAPGTRVVDDWIDEPVGHVRHLRVEFLIKLRLLERRGRDPGTLVAAQRRALGPTLDQLMAAGDGDVVDRWRAHNAAAVVGFLDDVG